MDGLAIDNLRRCPPRTKYTIASAGQFGAKLDRSCVLHQVDFTIWELNASLIAKYFSCRETMRATRQPFTVENPYSYDYCQRNIIDGVALASGQKIFPLKYRLGDAIRAAISSYTLYK
jgi:hypothetical protein